ncbi:MAG: phasin family protein [Pseudomonadota bacterium]
MTAAASPFTFPFSTFNADSFSSFFPDTDSMGSLTRGAMEASTASTRASVKGMQEASQAMMTNMKQQMNLSVETGKKLAEAESLEDALSIQTKYLKSAFEANLKSFNELSEVYTETLRDAFAPLAKQAKKASKSTKTA